MKKAFNTLTNEELCALTEDQLSEYVDLEVAAQGKPLIPYALPEPEHITVQPDCEVYVLERWNDLAVDKVTVDRLMKVLESAHLQRVDYNKALQAVTLGEDYNAPQVMLHRFESEERRSKYAPARKLTKTRWEEYNERDELRKTAFAAREEILDSMTAQISSARSEVRNTERLRADWDKYLKLANNDRVVAKNFFTDRHSAEAYDRLLATDA